MCNVRPGEASGKVVLVAVLPKSRVVTPFTTTLGGWPNLGIGYLSALIEKAGHDSLPIDWSGDSTTVGELVEQIKAAQPILVGFSLSNVNLELSRQIIVALRRVYSGPIVVGGYTATFHAADLLRRWNEIDYVVLREGEEAVVRLLEHLQGTTPLNEVPNLAYRNGPDVITTRPALPTNVQEIPWPERHWPQVGKFTPILSRRGCAYGCTICSIHNFYKTKSRFPVRFRTPEDVVAELAYCHEKEKEKPFSFYDDNFGLRTSEEKRWTERFIKELSRRDLQIKFYVETRVRDVIGAPELIAGLGEVGLTMVSLGAESLLPRQLKLYAKGHTPADVFRAVEILRKERIEPQTNIIFWDPFSTIPEALEHLGLLDQLGIQDQVLSSNQLFFIVLLVPYPGTRIFLQLHQAGLLRLRPGSFHEWHYDFVDQSVRELHQAKYMGRMLGVMVQTKRIPALWGSIQALQRNGRRDEAAALRNYGREIAHLDFDCFQTVLTIFAQEKDSAWRDAQLENLFERYLLDIQRVNRRHAMLEYLCSRPATRAQDVLSRKKTVGRPAGGPQAGISVLESCGLPGETTVEAIRALKRAGIP